MLRHAAILMLLGEVSTCLIMLICNLMVYAVLGTYDAALVIAMCVSIVLEAYSFIQHNLQLPAHKVVHVIRCCRC